MDPTCSSRKLPILIYMILRIRCGKTKGWQQLGMVNTQDKCKIKETITTTTTTEEEDDEEARTQTPQGILGHPSVIICVVQMVLTFSSFIYQIR